MLLLVLLGGLIIGSFLNVLIARFFELETVVNTRSHCMSCKKEIAWYDLVPFLSFVLLSGRCRYCDEKISWQYPIVEALTAVLALLLFSQFGLTVYSVGLFLVFSLLLVVSVIDINHHLIPDEYALTAVLLAFATVFLRSDAMSFDGIAAGALLGGGFLALLVFLSGERWMGMGDISLGLIIGLLSGVAGSVVGLTVAFVVGAIFSILLLLSHRKGRKDHIPFGPFLVLGALVATLWGDQLANWYLNLIRFM